MQNQTSHEATPAGRIVGSFVALVRPLCPLITHEFHMWSQTDWFPFIYCLENLDRATAAQNWKSCVQPSGLDLAPLLECSTSPLGAKVIF